MLNSIKKILEGVVSKGIYDLIKYILFLIIAGITGLVSNFIVLNQEYLVSYTIIITVIAAITLCLLGLLVYKQSNPIFNIYKKTDFKYIFIEKEIFYDYTNLNCIKYEKKIKLKVICDNLDRFYDKYHWTGSNAPLITSANKIHEIVLTPKKDSYQPFEVHFGRTYRKGDIIDLKLTFIMQDKERVADTAVSTTIDEPIRNLKIKIKVSKDYREGTATAAIFPMIDGRNSIGDEEKYFDNDGLIEWEIKDPPMLLKYSLKWESPQ